MHDRRRRGWTLALLLTCACATTPKPGSSDAVLAERLANIEAETGALQVEIADQEVKVPATYASVSRVDLQTHGRAPACALVRTEAGRPPDAATPARFELAKKKFRVKTTWSSAPVGKPAAGACAVVSP